MGAGVRGLAAVVARVSVLLGFYRPPVEASGLRATFEKTRGKFYLRTARSTWPGGYLLIRVFFNRPIIYI